MMDFFDYIFYRVYKGYLKFGEKDIPGIYSSGLIAMVQFLNVSSMIFLVTAFFKIDLYYNKLVLIGAFGAILFINYYRVFKVIGIENFNRRWEQEQNARKARYNRWMIAYFTLSIVILVASIWYRNSVKDN